MAFMDTGFKKLFSVHDRMTIEMERCMKETNILEWLTKVKTTMIQENTEKETTPHYYRPINAPIDDVRNTNGTN